MALQLYIIATSLVFLSFSQPLTAIRGKELWEGIARIYIRNLTADQVWPFVEDYCNIHKVFPVTVSFCVGGVSLQPGQRRYLASVVPPSNGNSSGTTIRWEEQSLVEMNSIKRVMKFEFINNNENVKMFEATMHVAKRHQGCELTWKYKTTPTVGYTNQVLLAELNGRLLTASVNMEQAVLQRT